MTRTHRPLSFWLLAAVFASFVLFLYGPMAVIFVLSLQGPEGGLTFPMRGFSLHWFHELWQGRPSATWPSSSSAASLKAMVRMRPVQVAMMPGFVR